MRLFPRTARRRLATTVTAVAVVAGGIWVPLANAEDLKDRHEKVEKKVEHAHSALEDSSQRLRDATERVEAAVAELDSARAELDETRTRLGEAKVRDREMQARLAAAEQRLVRAEEDLTAGRVALAEQREDVIDIINDTYQGGNPELLAFASLLNAETSSDLTRRDEVRDVIVGKETSAYDQLRATEVLLEVRQDQVEEVRDEVEVRREEAAEHLALMQELTVQAQEAKQRVRDSVRDRRDARQDAAQARRSDQRKLAELRAQERRIEQRIARAAARAARAAQRSGGFRGNPGGLFSRPVPGYITSPFGYRTHPIYGYYGLHNGTDFSAPCGTALRAIGDGKVLSSYYSSVYGRRLYIGLGIVNGRYLTAIYNHASSYTVGQGATVKRGQVIGYSGDTGWSTACHLHFTILAGGKPVNPMNYL